MGAYVSAVLSLRGDPGGNMSTAAAIDLVRKTPPEQRSSFAKEIWRIRRSRHGATGREEIPF